MAKFESSPVTVQIPADQIFSRFNDLTELQQMLEKLPDEARAKIGDVKFEKDSITIQTTQVGEIKFVVKERVEPEKVVFGTESSPVPLTLTARLKAVGADATEIKAETDVEIPAMLKPLIGGAMQKATDQFGQLIAQLASVKPQN